MKKLAIAGLLAAVLSLTCLSQQKAAAWGTGSWNFNIGLNLTMGGSWNCNPGCNQGYCPSGFCWGYQDSGYNGYNSYPGYCASAYPAPAYPAPQAAPAPAAPAPAVQNAGYFYPAEYGYGTYQAPSYWYGR